MSLKAGFVLFYIAFLSILIFFTAEVGVSVLDIERSTLVSITDRIDIANDPIGAFFQILVNTLLFFTQTFIILSLVTVTDPTFLILSIFVILPLTITFFYIIIEVIRGVGG